jgi:hypothetical protein
LIAIEDWDSPRRSGVMPNIHLTGAINQIRPRPYYAPVKSCPSIKASPTFGSVSDFFSSMIALCVVPEYITMMVTRGPWFAE